MFVVDALIGNYDRNNGNWGVLLDRKTNNPISLSPVYDNGACFYHSWDDEKLKKSLKEIQIAAYKRYTCCYLGEKHRINPFDIIQKRQYPDYDDAFVRICKKFPQKKIISMIDELKTEGRISEIHDIAIKSIINVRINEVLFPAYNKILEERGDSDYHIMIESCKNDPTNLQNIPKERQTEELIRITCEACEGLHTDPSCLVNYIREDLKSIVGEYDSREELTFKPV